MLESEVVIASRFHANVISIMFGKKLLPVVYSEKTSNILKDIGINKKIISIDGMGQVESKNVEEFYIDTNNLKLLKDTINNADLQFKVMRKCIKDAEKNIVYN